MKKSQILDFDAFWEIYKLFCRWGCIY